MTIQDTVKTLRNKENITYFDKERKEFILITYNKDEEFVCWKKFVSKDRRNWVNHNLYMSLKDVLAIRQEMIDQRLKLLNN
jgi:hypothetical protein